MIRIIKKQSVYQKETEGYKIMGNLPPYKKNDRFSPSQKSTLFFCFLAYVITYLVRVNISVALPFMASEVGMSTTTQGFLSGAFLWCYALGQFLFGRLGDKISGKPLIFIGLLGSAFCNLTLGLLSRSHGDDFYMGSERNFPVYDLVSSRTYSFCKFSREKTYPGDGVYAFCDSYGIYVGLGSFFHILNVFFMENYLHYSGDSRFRVLFFIRCVFQRKRKKQIAAIYKSRYKYKKRRVSKSN